MRSIRSPLDGFASPLGRRTSGGAAFPSIAMTGLTSGVAEIGDQATISVGFPVGVTAWTSQAWGASYGVSTYGTGANPTDFAAGNGGSLLWEGVGDDGNTYRSTAPIRYPAPVLGALTNQTINGADFEPTYDISVEVTFLGTASYSLTVTPSEGGATISTDGVITWNTETLVLQSGTTITVRVSDAADPTRFDEASFNLTVGSVPGVMAAPTLTALSATSFRIVQAAAPAANNGTISSYDAQYSTSLDMAGAVTLTGITNPEDVTGAVPDTTYYVRTRAVNEFGEAIWGTIASVTTNSATITLTKVSEDFSTSSPAITITHTGGTSETVYWEFDGGTAPVARGAGSIGSGTAGTLGGALSIDLSAFELLTGYLHISAGTPGSSNTLIYATDGEGFRAFTVPEAVGGTEFPETDTAAIFWIDASDTATITHSSGTVSAVADKIAAAEFAPSGTVETGTTTIDGKNVLAVTNGQLLSPETDLTGNLALHMVCDIGAVDNLSDSLFLLRSADSSGTTTGQLFRLYANNSTVFNGRWNYRNGAGSARNLSLSGAPFSGLTLVSLVWNVSGQTLTVFMNNVSAGSESRGEYADDLPATSRLHIFGDWDQSLSGSVAEVILTRDVSNRADYTTYLATKWGITL